MSHFYNPQTGELVDPWTKGSYPSPSTILDIIRNDGLEAFRARVGEEEADAHMLAAQERGTRVHKACELFLLNGHDAIKAASAAELQIGEVAYLGGFIGWWEKYQPELVATELFLVNHTLRYAGRSDLIVKLDGQLWIVDIKTGVTREKHGLQTRFYAEAWLDMANRRYMEQLAKAIDGHTATPAKPTLPRMGCLYLDDKRASGYRYFKSPYGLLEYKEPLAAIKNHLAVYKWWAKKHPIKEPKIEPVWEPEDMEVLV